MKQGVQLTGDWAAVDKMTAAFRGALEDALKEEAEFMADKVRAALKSVSLQLSPNTLRLRKLRGFGGTKPLLAKGDLYNSIKGFAEGLEVFVGVTKNATAKDGTSLVNIAAVQENGATIILRITPAMRRFLFGVLFKGEDSGGGKGGGGVAGGIIVIKIPARPFLRPAFEQWGPGLTGRVAKRIAARLPLDLT